MLEDLDLSFLDFSLGALEVARHVRDEVVSVIVGHDGSEEVSRLLEV